MFTIKYFHFVIKRTKTTVIPHKQQTERFAAVVLSAFRFNTFHCLFNDNCCFHSYDFYHLSLIPPVHKQIIKCLAFNSTNTERSVKINILPRNVTLFILNFLHVCTFTQNVQHLFNFPYKSNSVINREYANILGVLPKIDADKCTSHTTTISRRQYY